MPFCPKCGKEAPSEAVFCPSCGSALKVVEETPHKNNRKKAVAIVLVIIVFSMIGWNLYQAYSLSQLRVEYNNFNVNIDYLFLLPIGLKLNIGLRISNPSSITVYVPDVDFSVYLGSEYLTEGHISGRTISSHSTIYVSVPFSFDWLKLGSALINVLKQFISTGRIIVVVKGTAYARMSIIPFLPIYYTIAVPFNIEKQL